MTEEEIIEELALLTTAIQHIYKTGQSYSLGTGASNRQFTAGNYDSYVSQRRLLRMELADIQDGGGGVLLGF